MWARTGTLLALVVLAAVGCSQERAERKEGAGPVGTGGPPPPVASAPPRAAARPAVAPQSQGSWHRHDLATVHDPLGGDVFTGSIEVPPEARFEGFRLANPELIPTGAIRIGGLEIGLGDSLSPWTLAKFKAKNKITPERVLKEEALADGYRLTYRDGGGIVVATAMGKFTCSANVRQEDQAALALRVCSSYRPAPGGR